MAVIAGLPVKGQGILSFYMHTRARAVSEKEWLPAGLDCLSPILVVGGRTFISQRGQIEFQIIQISGSSSGYGWNREGRNKKGKKRASRKHPYQSNSFLAFVCRSDFIVTHTLPEFLWNDSIHEDSYLLKKWISRVDPKR